MKLAILVTALLSLILPSLSSGIAIAQSLDTGVWNRQTPPVVDREFRGVWIATVDNIDWPSKPGLSTQQQKDELLGLIEMAAQMHLNAIIFQVRTSADALYESKIEPWSPYISGTQGKAPAPLWDPLDYAVEQAHRRGLELHAWINPLRALHPSYKGKIAPNHVSRRLPDAVYKYGNNLWMDPGRRDTLQYTLRVIKDIVSRYDVDGLHLDDYFYPYPKRDDDGKIIRFPDQKTYQAYQDNGGEMDLANWRRHNVDRMIRAMGRTVHETKPYVKFGISPFGIWRPGHPPQIKGMDQYENIYANPKKWLEEGWCDYLSPQLYWRIANPDQSYTALLRWWIEHNPHDRHVWPGLFTSRTENGSSSSFNKDEIGYQIEWSRIILPKFEDGHIHFSMKVFKKNHAELRDSLHNGVYANKAIPPATPWLPHKALPEPEIISAQIRGDQLDVAFDADSTGEAYWIVVQAKRGGRWFQTIVSGEKPDISLSLPGDADLPEMFWVRAFDRNANETGPFCIKINKVGR